MEPKRGIPIVWVWLAVWAAMVACMAIVAGVFWLLVKAGV